MRAIGKIEHQPEGYFVEGVWLEHGTTILFPGDEEEWTVEKVAETYQIVRTERRFAGRWSRVVRPLAGSIGARVRVL